MHKHFAVAYIGGLGGLRKFCLIPTDDKQSNATNWLYIATAANMPVVLPLWKCVCLFVFKIKLNKVQFYTPLLWLIQSQYLPDMMSTRQISAMTDKILFSGSWVVIQNKLHRSVTLKIAASNCGPKKFACSIVPCHYTTTQMRVRPPNVLISQQSSMYPAVTPWLNILMHSQSFPGTFTLQWDEIWWHFFMHGNHVADYLQVFAGMLWHIVSSLICSGKDNVV